MELGLGLHVELGLDQHWNNLVQYGSGTFWTGKTPDNETGRTDCWLAVVVIGAQIRNNACAAWAVGAGAAENWRLLCKIDKFWFVTIESVLSMSHDENI